MDFGTLLERSAIRLPHKTAVVSGTVRLSYQELDRRVNRLARALLVWGVKPQKKVAIACHNTNEYAEVVFACAKINAVSVHLNWRMSAQEMAYHLNAEACSLLFFSEHFAETYEALMPLLEKPLSVIAIGGKLPQAIDYEKFIEGRPETRPVCPLPGDDDIAMELFTSGTTSRPKGVLLSHKSMVCHVMTNIIEAEWTEDTCYLFSTPLFHAASCGAYITLLCGGTLVLTTGMRFPDYLELIVREKVTRIAVVPVLLKRILEYSELADYDLSSLRIVGYSSAPMPPELIQRALSILHCGFLQTYGMTEMGPVICVLGSQDHCLTKEDGNNKRLYSAGKPVFSVDLRILREDGRECMVEEPGEVVVRGYGMMSGYSAMPQATAEAVRDGWYYTGDIACRDEAGYVYIVDRKADVIISGGENISSREVENCILQLEKDVDMAAVIGVPDAIWGETVKAFVVRKPNSPITERDIVCHCKGNIASYKKPSSVEFVDELPINANGKIIKNVLRQRYWEQCLRKV